MFLKFIFFRSLCSNFFHLDSFRASNLFFNIWWSKYWGLFIVIGHKWHWGAVVRVYYTRPKDVSSTGCRWLVRVPLLIKTILAWFSISEKSFAASVIKILQRKLKVIICLYDFDHQEDTISSFSAAKRSWQLPQLSIGGWIPASGGSQQHDFQISCFFFFKTNQADFVFLLHGHFYIGK